MDVDGVDVALVATASVIAQKDHNAIFSPRTVDLSKDGYAKPVDLRARTSLEFKLRVRTCTRTCTAVEDLRRTSVNQTIKMPSLAC